MSTAAALAPVTPLPPDRRVGLGTWLTVFTRLLAIQGAWNYETLLGNGVGFCMEPLLRRLPGGVHGARFRDALARESTYFNAHPYFAAVAVGALARVELSDVPPALIERFRTALAGPLGSVGDRLVWAGWLPLTSLAALVAFGFGASPTTMILVFLLPYNLGHLALRAWALHVGWTRGLGVASALASPLLRQAPNQIARAASAVAGVAVPLAAARLVGGAPENLLPVLAAAAVGAILLVRVYGRRQGWTLALLLLVLFALVSVVGR